MPFGSPGSVNLLAALDRRLEDGTLEPAAVAPVARLLGVGTLIVKSDLEYERYDSPLPRDVWQLLTHPSASGLGVPVGFGPSTPNVPPPSLATPDARALRASGTAWPPAVALIPVRHPGRIVQTASPARPSVVSGDGDGIVDATAAGLLDGHGVILYSSTLGPAELRDALHRDAQLVVTDSNRRRARRWNVLKEDVGYTERAGQVALETDDDDFRLDVAPDERDADRTVVEQRGAQVDATGYGDVGVYLPEDRPAHAFDGDLRTAWRVGGGGGDPTGQHLIVRPDHPVRADRVTLVQPPGGRFITQVKLSFDRGAPVTVALDERSRECTGPGRAVLAADRASARHRTAGGQSGIGRGRVRRGRAR